MEDEYRIEYQYQPDLDWELYARTKRPALADTYWKECCGLHKRYKCRMVQVKFETIHAVERGGDR